MQCKGNTYRGQAQAPPGNSLSHPAPRAARLNSDLDSTASFIVTGKFNHAADTLTGVVSDSCLPASFAIR
jgi:hypothetical protein